MIPTVLALLVVVLATPLNWYVTAKLWRLSLASPDLRALRERAVAALALALIVTVFAVVFVNNEMKPPPLDNDATKLLTRGALLALAVIPDLYWLRLYRR